MMKKAIPFVLIIMISFLFIPQVTIAENNLKQADAIYDKGGRENYKQSIDLYLKAVQENPENYEANWKTARAYREYCEWSVRDNVQDWKKICATFAKKGMTFGEKAIKLNPNGVEGQLYYGLCVGNYSDGVSIIKALKEGLKGKTQNAFEASYKIDKMYRDGGPIIACGRFWSVLPWPLKKRKTAIEYLKEAYTLFPDNPEVLVYYGEVLMEKKKSRPEAKQMLEKAAATKDDPYFSKWAKRLLEKL